MASSRRLYAAVFAAAYLVALLLLWLNGPAKTLGIRDYISDEVWYVSAAVNIARSVFGIHIVPYTDNGTVVYTVFYNTTACTRAEAEALAESIVPGARVLNKTYEKIHAFVLEAPRAEDGLASSLPREAAPCIVDAMPGIAPDNDGINHYLNTEHPPLVKYVLILVLATRGWDPAAWRLASFAAAALGLAAATYAAYRATVEQDRRSLAVAALAAAVLPAAAARDPSLSAMASVAMLDIYTAALDAVSLALLLARRHRAAGTALGLAASAKYTGLFPLPALALATRLDTGSTRRTLAATILAPLVVLAAAWAPFAAARGPAWVLDQLAGALAWHTTSRPPGPPSTTPLGLILGRDGFVLHYTPQGQPLIAAVCNPGVCLTGVLAGAAAAATALAARCRRLWRTKHLTLLANGAYPLAAWMGYAAVYAAGNHTLYSFYSVQISLLSIPALAAIPLLIEEAHVASPRPTAGCVLTRWAPYASAASAAAGLAASAALAHGWPAAPPSPLEPLSAAIGAPDKLARIGLFASALLLYTATPARTVEPGPQGPRWAARWLLAGLLAYAGPLGPLAPILYLAAQRPGVFEALLAGVAGPGPAGYAAAAHHRGPARARYVAGYTLGYLASLGLLAASGPPPLLTLRDAALAAAGYAAALAAYSLPVGPGVAYALAAAVSPSALPLLALAPGGLPAAAVVAALGLASGAAWFARVAALAALAAAAAGEAAAERFR